jgi:hypothetical protein
VKTLWEKRVRAPPLLEDVPGRLFTFDVDVAVEELITLGRSGARLVVTGSQPESDDIRGRRRT